MCAGRFGLGWAHDIFNVSCHMFMHFSCIHTFISLYSDIKLFGAFLFIPLSLSLSLFLVALCHLNRNLLCLGTLFVPGYLPLILLLHTLGSVMIKPERTFRRTFLDEAFIQNTKSSYQISPILTFPLSSTVGVGSHCVASQSCALPWSYRSFTPTCIDLSILYLSSGYAHYSHSRSYIQGATCTEGSAFWLPQLWSS